MVAYYFPPIGGVVVRRVLRMLRHLPQEGWRCTVLTAEHPYDPYHPQDPDAVRALPDVEAVLRAPARAGLERALAGAFGAVRSLRSLRRSAAAGGPAGGRLRVLLHNTVAFPDPKRFWISGAVRLASDHAQRDPFDAILASGYPWSGFVAADRLGSELRCPVVLDYRDAWTLNPRGLWDGRRQRALERAVVGRAAAVVTATEGIRSRTEQRFAPHRVMTLQNGYDSAEHPPRAPAGPRADRMSLVYTGTFNDALPPSPHDRTPFYLIEAVGRLAPEVRGRLRVRLVGNVGRRYRALIRGRSLETVFELPGSVTHRAALREQAAADVALLVLTEEGAAKGDVTGKLFEYMGSRCPVLALAPEAGEAARLIRAHDLGWVEPPIDVGRIARRLEWLVRAWGKGELPAAPPPVPEFEASSQAGQLARLLDQVVDEAATSSDTTRSAARPSP